MAGPTSRAFGCAAEDLEFDFVRADRPALVTALLDACAAPPGDRGWWLQAVSARTTALLGLLRASEGREAIDVTLRCEACGEPFEIALDHAALGALPPAPPSVQVARAGADALTLRLPTGDDLRAWRAQRPAWRDGMPHPMLASLCIAGAPQRGDESAAAEALAQADPLVSFTLECACPACGTAAAPEVDLEGLALRRLGVRQRGLLHEVHALASRYGWSEAEILALSAARRARYLDLIEGFR